MAPFALLCNVDLFFLRSKGAVHLCLLSFVQRFVLVSPPGACVLSLCGVVTEGGLRAKYLPGAYGDTFGISLRMPRAVCNTAMSCRVIVTWKQAREASGASGVMSGRAAAAAAVDPGMDL